MLDIRHMDRFWQRMKAIFPETWVSFYGEKDDGRWYNEIKHVPPERIALAIKSCEGRRIPPTIGQFRILCEGKEKGSLLYGVDQIKKIKEML